jgi:hypothetical protein
MGLLAHGMVLLHAYLVVGAAEPHFDALTTGKHDLLNRSDVWSETADS